MYICQYKNTLVHVQFLNQNQLCRFVRAVGYRWLAKWLFGCMGWENTRPLPACLYHELRSRYGSTHVQGYVSGQERGNTA